MPVSPPTLLEVLGQLAPGTPIRSGLERVIQHGNGALIVLGHNPEVERAMTGGFRLDSTTCTPARLAELSKMDGGIVLDDTWSRVLAANVHFIPQSDLPTDETGARHRTSERLAAQTGKPVVAVSEDRLLATVFYDGTKTELSKATAVTAKVNQQLQTLDSFRRRLDSAEQHLTQLEVSDFSTVSAVVALVQRTELVRRVGHSVERDAVGLGDEGALIRLQLADLVRGVEGIRDNTLRDYVKPKRESAVREAIESLEELPNHELDDPGTVAKTLKLGEMDESVKSRGLRILANASRLPESVRDEIVKHFRDLSHLLSASVKELEEVEGVGETRARQVRAYLDRVGEWSVQGVPDLT